MKGGTYKNPFASHESCVRLLNSTVILGMAVATISWSYTYVSYVLGSINEGDIPRAKRKIDITDFGVS